MTARLELTGVTEGKQQATPALRIVAHAAKRPAYPIKAKLSAPLEDPSEAFAPALYGMTAVQHKHDGSRPG